jgi:hypothetical protein
MSQQGIESLCLLNAPEAGKRCAMLLLLLLLLLLMLSLLYIDRLAQ